MKSRKFRQTCWSELLTISVLGWQESFNNWHLDQAFYQLQRIQPAKTFSIVVVIAVWWHLTFGKIFGRMFLQLREIWLITVFCGPPKRFN